MKVIHHSIIYENPLPQLRSRQSLFPWLCEMPDGSLLASHCIGEAFESIDGTSYLSKSFDGGKTFSKPKPMFERDERLPNSNDTCKVTYLHDGRLVALGYAYERSDPDLPIGNPETGGLLDDFLFVSYSSDQGDTWSPWQLIECSWGPHVEASAPLTVLQNGSWVTPITGFPKWMEPGLVRTVEDFSVQTITEKPGRMIPFAWNLKATKSPATNNGFANWNPVQ